MPDKHSNKERIKEITAGIEKGIQELFESDRYRNYLTTMSRFHRYSLNNVMLIHAQKPDATDLGEANFWRGRGGYIRKGESGILLMEPGNSYTRKDGSKGVGINVKRVFDISQTTLSPVPEL